MAGHIPHLVVVSLSHAQMRSYFITYDFLGKRGIYSKTPQNKGNLLPFYDAGLTMSRKKSSAEYSLQPTAPITKSNISRLVRRSYNRSSCASRVLRAPNRSEISFGVIHAFPGSAISYPPKSDLTYLKTSTKNKPNSAQCQRTPET